MSVTNGIAPLSGNLIGELRVSSRPSSQNSASAAEGTASFGRQAVGIAGSAVGGAVGVLYKGTGEVLKNAVYGAMSGGRLTIGGTAAGILSGKLPNSANMLQRYTVVGMGIGAAVGAVYAVGSNLGSIAQGWKAGAASGEQFAYAAFDTGIQTIGKVADKAEQSFSSVVSGAKNTIDSFNYRSKQMQQGYDLNPFKFGSSISVSI